MDPEEKAYPEVEGYSTRIPSGDISVLINGGGEVEVSWLNEDMPTLVGSLFNQLNANGKIIEEQSNGDIIERSFMLEALFVSDDMFQGEFKEWILLNDDDTPAATSSRNVTGVRLQAP